MKKYFLLIGFFVFYSLLVLSGCKDETNPVTPPEEHFQPEGWLVRDAALKPILVVFQGEIQSTWNGVLLDTIFKAPLNALSDHYSVKFLTAQREILNPPTSTAYSLGFVITDASVLEIVKDSPTEWAFHLKGKKLGTTQIELQAVHGNHADVKTPKIPVSVVIDTTAYGEPVGLRLTYEDDGLLILSTSGTTVTGSVVVQKDSLTDHIKVEFNDENGRYFQPEYPLHSIGITVADTAIAEVIPETGEPWVIRIRGKITGTTTFQIKVIVNGSVEFISVPLPLTVN